MGGSAGGLLMGAVINQAPQLYNAVVAQVPFVDVVTTMLDDSIPLTTGEYEEWGNPHQSAAYALMKSYSPYDNVRRQRYPNLLVTSGLYDSQVQYWEPAKWVAKLRRFKQGDSLLLLSTDMTAGHGGKSAAWRGWKTARWSTPLFWRRIGRRRNNLQRRSTLRRNKTITTLPRFRRAFAGHCRPSNLIGYFWGYMKIKMIASLIGAGLALYGPAAAAQEQAENNKGSVAFSPLNVSAADGGKSSEKTHWPGRARSARAMKTRIWSRWTAFCAVCRAPIPRSIPARIGQRQYSRPERLWPGQHHGRRHHAKLLRQLAERRSARGLPTSQFGALIDPNFIVGVDVARGNATGSAGVNALAGSANFRTIGVDDVVFSDNPFGVRTKFSVGNNGIGRSGMIAVGAKTAAFADGGSLGRWRRSAAAPSPPTTKTAPVSTARCSTSIKPTARTRNLSCSKWTSSRMLSTASNCRRAATRIKSPAATSTATILPQISLRAVLGTDRFQPDRQHQPG